MFGHCDAPVFLYECWELSLADVACFAVFRNVRGLDCTRCPSGIYSPFDPDPPILVLGVLFSELYFLPCLVPTCDWVPRATMQVKYVVSQGFPGAFWYIGNEDGAPQHATLIAEHCRAIKAVDPTLKCGWNDNNLNPDSLTVRRL